MPELRPHRLTPNGMGPVRPSARSLQHGHAHSTFPDNAEPSTDLCPPRIDMLAQRVPSGEGGWARRPRRDKLAAPTTTAPEQDGR